MRPMFFFLLLVLLSASPVQAFPLLLSTDGPASLGGVAFNPDDIIQYDPVTNAASLFMNGDLEFAATNEDIDALFRLSNGNIVLSTTGSASLGALINFEMEDLVEYNIATNVASMFFDGDAEFAAEEDIEGLWVFDDGTILFTTNDGGTFGALTLVEEEDIVRYNPTTNVASLYFDGDAEFTLAEEDLDAFSLLDGRLILSTTTTATLGTLTFQPDDLVEYDPVTNVASLFMNGDLEFLATNENIDAVFIPEPSTAALLAVGLAGLAVAGRRRN